MKTHEAKPLALGRLLSTLKRYVSPHFAKDGERLSARLRLSHRGEYASGFGLLSIELRHDPDRAVMILREESTLGSHIAIDMRDLLQGDRRRTVPQQVRDLAEFWYGEFVALEKQDAAQ